MGKQLSPRLANGTHSLSVCFPRDVSSKPVLCSHLTEMSTPAAGTCFQRQPGPFQFGNGGRELFAASVCFQVNFFRWSFFFFFFFTLYVYILNNTPKNISLC